MTKKVLPLEDLRQVLIIGLPQEFYPQLYKARQDNVVIEEFISMQVVPQEQPKLSGIQQLQPQMTAICSALLIVEKPKA